MSIVERIFTVANTHVREKLFPWFRARPRRAAYTAGFVLGGVLLFGYVSGGKQGPPTSGGTPIRADAAPTSRPSTQPADRFYDPNADGADPTWALPAELSAQEVNGLIQDLDKLQQETWRLAARIQAKYDEQKVLDADDVRQAIWQRVTGEGFRERTVPLLYHEVMRDGSGLLTGIAPDLSHEADRRIFQFLNNRIAAAQVRLLGGRCLVGDKLFIKSTGALVASMHAEYDAIESKRNELIAKLAKEFTGFSPFRESVLQTEKSSYVRLPHSDGYRRLSGATKNQ